MNTLKVDQELFAAFKTHTHAHVLYDYKNTHTAYIAKVV